MSSRSSHRLDAAEVKLAADGRWQEILPAVARIDADALDERHHSRPKCGGTDRLRCLDADTGALFCNQCFHTKSGDGFAAVAWLNECSFPDAVRTVAEYLNPPGSQSGHATNGKAVPKSKPSTSKGTGYKTASAAVAALMTKFGKPAGQWIYHDAGGNPVAFVLRFNKADGSKEFRPVSLQNGGGWYIKAPPTPRPLYGLPDLAGATTVYVC